jgi:cytoskeleton protein RodZ
MNEQQAMTGVGSGTQYQGVGGTPPYLLRQTREAAGLHIAALAAALKVPVRKLEALEAGRYDELPDMTFARALASSACRQLKVDPGPVLEQIPHGNTPALGVPQDAINAPFKSANSSGSLNILAWLTRPTVLGVLVLLLGAVALMFLPDRFLGFLQTSNEPVLVTPSDSPVGEPGAVVEPVVIEDTATPGLTLSMSSPSSTVSGTADAGASTADTTTGSATTATEPAERGGSTALLTITATAESWIEVVNGSGGVVMQRVLKAGDVVDFSTSPPYSVVLGRAEAVQVMVRGKAFDVQPYARNNVARFEVK